MEEKPVKAHYDLPRRSIVLLGRFQCWAITNNREIGIKSIEAMFVVVFFWKLHAECENGHGFLTYFRPSLILFQGQNE